MKKVFYIIIPLLFLAAMEGAAWLVFRSSEKPVATSVSKPVNQQEEFEPKLQEEAIPGESKEETVPASGMSSINSESFPSPSTEEVNGVTERTIHMGVRQWKWDPRVIRAKEGELVRLVIHNADVKHAIVIPALNVQQDRKSTRLNS